LAPKTFSLVLPKLLLLVLTYIHSQTAQPNPPLSSDRAHGGDAIFSDEDGQSNIETEKY
jgi:hypothetical protein